MPSLLFYPTERKITVIIRKSIPLWNNNKLRRYSAHNNFMTKFILFQLDYVSPGVCSKLTHRGRVTHICVSKLTIIGSNNGLSPGRRQAIIWTNAAILLIGPLGTNFSELLIEILTFSFKKMRLKVWSAKWRPFCLGLNVLTVEERAFMLARSQGEYFCGLSRK